MIQVIDRVFNILEHLRDSQVLSLSCLAKHMGLNKSTRNSNSLHSLSRRRNS